MVILTNKRFEELVRRRVEEAKQEDQSRYEMELLMKQANIASLQSQINPHFLYNALECIRGQAVMDGSDDIARITQALSRFFRYSISGKKDLVTVGEELENAGNYVTIQQYRFRDKFVLESEVEEGVSVLDAVLPKLSLQPILENAIVHGFADMVRGGVLRIEARREGSEVVLRVSDNGKGMAVERLNQLIETLHEAEGLPRESGSGHGTGIGIRNVDRRLKLLFGEAYGLSLESVEQVGTAVELIFPYMTETSFHG